MNTTISTAKFAALGIFMFSLSCLGQDTRLQAQETRYTANVQLQQQTKCTGCTVCWFGTGHGMYRDRGKSSPKIAEGMWTDIGGHLLVESSGIRKGSTPTRGVYRDRGKSSPKIAHSMWPQGKESPKIAHGMAPDRQYMSHPKTGYPGYPCSTCGKFHELSEKRPDNSWTDWLFRMLGY